ncbi:MAG: hypothetical protein RLZZ53_3194 [Acidobacteriota bacterium]
MPFLLIFIVALAVRLLHLWQLTSTPFFDVLLGDANGYDQWAQRLAAGDWVGSEVFYQAPLYPYFLGSLYAMFGRDLLVVRIIQALVGSASCVLLGMAATRLFSRPAGLIAGLGLALWAPAIFFDSLLQKAVLDMFFMCASLYLVACIIDSPPEGGRPSSETEALPAPAASGFSRTVGIALGASLAAFALTRENGLLLIAVVAIWLALQHRRQLVFLAIGLGIVFTPVVIRNYSIDGGIYLTTSQFGSNFYIGNNPNADGTYASIRFGRGAPEFERIDATEVAEEAEGRTLTAAEVSRFWTGRALSYITSQPGDWLALTGRKILLLFNRSEMVDTESQETYEEFSAPLKGLAWLTHFGLLVPLAVLGLLASWPDRRRLWIIYALGATYAASVVMFFVFARYRYPMVPFLLVLGAYGATSLRLQASRQQWLATGAAIGLTAIFANVTVLDGTLMRALTENNLGTAFGERGRYDEAIAHHEKAIALKADYAPAYNNLGATLRAAGRLDEAVAQYRKALELKPDFASASYNLANAQLEQGKAADSVESFRRSLQANPNSVEAHNNLGTALAARGEIAEAIAEFRAAITLDARSVHAHRNLGNLLYDRGERAEALAHFERAIAAAPNESEALYDLATLLLQEQNFRAAEARFAAVLKITPDSAQAHNNLGIAIASQGRVKEALSHFERAVELNPSMQDARANRDQARAALRQ